jgi:hypothetical protein
MPVPRRTAESAARGPLAAACALAGWLAVVAAASGGETMGVPAAADGLVEVSIGGWAGIGGQMDGRDAGLMPLEVTIANKSRSPRTWSVSPVSRMVQAEAAVPTARIGVPAASTVKRTLFVDSASGAGLSAYLRVDGPGIADGHFQFGVSAAGGPNMLATVGGTAAPALPTAVSRGVVASQGRAFEGRSMFGGGLDLAAPPEDWRGWTQFPVVLCTEAEWLGMNPAARRALLERLALGGRAGVLVAAADPARIDGLRLPPRDPSGRRRIGAGEFVTVEWDGETLTREAFETFASGIEPGMQAKRFAEYGGTRQRFRNTGTYGEPLERRFARLTGVFGPRSLPLVPIVWFLGLLAVIAGPVNLLVFAGPGRRSRLFWTTPAISLVATAILLGLIFTRDGFGGRGARRVLALLLPGQNATAIVQEQFSRTGVLLSGGFPIAEPAWMRPVGDFDLDAGFHESDDAWRSGDWFSSRADQAFVIQTVRPSRSGIELVSGGDAPEVISSIDRPLGRVFVIDEQGRHWTAAGLGTGERRLLEPSTAGDYEAWLARHEADAGPVRLAALAAVRSLPGHAYAEARSAAGVAVATHDAIRWEDELVLYAGPYTTTSRP